MLRPVVRLALGHVSYYGFVSIVDELFYEEGYNATARMNPGRQISNRMIVALTGLPSRRVSLLRRAAVSGSPRAPSTAYAPPPEASILEFWRLNFPYSNDNEPVPLPVDGPAPSFESLVQTSTSSEISAPEILSSLTRAGAVELVDGKVVCRARAFLALPGLDEASLRAISYSHDAFSSSIEHNLSLPPGSHSARWPQRQLFSRWVPAGAYEDLRTALFAQIERFTADTHDALESHERIPGRQLPTDQHYTVGVGLYYWERAP